MLSLNNNGSLATLIGEKKYIILLSIYTFILLVCQSKFSFLYATNEWADTNVYFTIGKAMFNGRTLYTEIFDHKGPFIFFLYGIGYWISNGSFFGMFLIELSSWLLMVYAVYLMARLFLSAGSSFLISIIFPVFLVKLMKAGGSAEEFILAYEAISLYLFVKYFKDKDASIHKPKYMFVHGILCTIVLLTKINLVMFWFFPLLGIFINILKHKEYKNCGLNILAFLGGTILIAAPITGYFLYHDALSDAYAIYIDLNRSYAEMSSFKGTVLLLLARILYLYIEPLSLLVLASIGIFYFPFKHIGNTIGKWSLALAGITSYVFIFMSPMFQIYYPIPFLTTTVLGLISLCLYLRKFVPVQYSQKMLIVLSVVVIFAGLGVKRLDNTILQYYILRNADNLPVKKTMTESLINEIKKEEDPTLLNLGFGLGVSLFTTCDIVPNVRYFMKPNLSYGIYPDLRDEQTRYIEDKLVQFIVIPEGFGKASNRRKRKGEEDDAKYYMALPSFQQNYTLILVDTIANSIDESMEKYSLYKRND